MLVGYILVLLDWLGIHAWIWIKSSDIKSSQIESANRFRYIHLQVRNSITCIPLSFFSLVNPLRFHSTHHRLNTSSYSLLYTYGHTPYVWMPMHEPNHLNSYYHWIFLPMIRRKIAPWRTSPHFSYSKTLMNYISPNSNSKCVLFFYISCFSMNFWLKQTKSDENWTSTTDNLMFVCAPGAYIVFLWWNCFLYICYFFSEQILYL